MEAALVELVDAARPGSPSLESECRLCGLLLEGGEQRRAGRRFTQPREVLAALTRWAEEDGEEDVEAFVTSNFVGRGMEDVVARILRGERVETSFDVIAFFFPGAAGAPAVARRRRADEASEQFLRSDLLSRLGSLPTAADPTSEPRKGPVPTPGVRRLVPLDTVTSDLGPMLPDWEPHHGTRALLAVVMADGDPDAAEEAAIAAACGRLGFPLPTEADRRRWRPAELAIPPKPAELLKAMIAVARADGAIDRSEVRVIVELARHWGTPVDEAKLEPATGLRAITEAMFGRGR